MTRYCQDEALRKWNNGPDDSYCPRDPTLCRHVVAFGNNEYCGWCPPRVTQHQVIRSQAGCLWCRYATKGLTYGRCAECLCADTRINFEDEKEVR